MSNYYNDSPIESFEDDRFGIGAFAKAMAKSLLNMETPVGTAIALNGPWGSGKSSAVNLIRRELEEHNDRNLVVSDFKCWWYRGEEALALAFLQDLHALLKSSFGDKVKDLIPSLTKRLLQAGPVIGPAMSLATGAPVDSIVTAAAKFANDFFPDGETVEKLFDNLMKALGEESRRFLIIIDDIDRLSPDEAMAMFRLVKSVGRLPNVMYLLVFDRQLAEKAVAAKYPSEGPHYLEKIIQAGFELPMPLQIDLNNAVLSSLEHVCGPPDEDQVQRIMNIFYDTVAPYITTPRHVVRFQNAISVTWPAIANEVNVADFMALETIRLYEPALFKAIRAEKDLLCGLRASERWDRRDDRRFDPFLREVPDGRHEVAKLGLQRLFPAMETIGYGGESRQEWDAQRCVCIAAHFDTYFRMSLSDEALSLDKINELIARANDADFVKDAFLKAAATERRGGTSMVPVYLDELTSHARRVDKEKVGPLLETLFEIHDDIDLQKDEERGFGAIANTSLRYHWLIRRLTRDRFTLDERTELYSKATEHASLGWLVDFVRSARNDYRTPENRGYSEDDCLVSESALETLSTRGLNAIRAAAADGSLLHHRDLIRLLYTWRSLVNNDPIEVRVWTDSYNSNGEALVILAGQFTGQSRSMSIGGFGGSLGDRISTLNTVAQIGDDVDIVDLEAFRTGLERIRDQATVDEASLKTVRNFLAAWDRKRRGEED